MARLPRLLLPDQPLHIMHRGNNRQNILENKECVARILNDIAESLAKTDCQLHKINGVRMFDFCRQALP
jgi:putative transposase|tara:strand:- start:87 stop:293 length:207 start_codon:yes stop_codon:yes gene_type:complete